MIVIVELRASVLVIIIGGGGCQMRGRSGHGQVMVVELKERDRTCNEMLN